MGRDDAKPIAGLHGGTAPAKAWAAFMKPATANRPIEQFDTKVTLPEWQLEPDEQGRMFTRQRRGDFLRYLQQRLAPESARSAVADAGDGVRPRAAFLSGSTLLAGCDDGGGDALVARV